MILLKDIYVYPVKSLGGFRVDSWPIGVGGLQYDRHWMLIDEAGQFLSQRRLPKMALIKTAMTQESLALSAPGQSDLQIGLQQENGKIAEAEIWKDHCVVKEVAEQANQWLSDFLGFSCRLVFLLPEHLRQVDLNYARHGDLTSLSDGFPFLIIGEASLNQLNTHLIKDAEMLRFRPNLVVGNCEAYAEDSWRTIQIGDISFRLPKPCSRCSVPGINPHTAEISNEPLVTLNRLRRSGGKIYFGQNAIHDKIGSLKVGERVSILESGARQPPI